MYKSISVFVLTVVLFGTSVMAAETVVVVPLGGEKPTGDAQEKNVLTGKTFSNNNNIGLSGSMQDNGAVTITPSTTDQSIAEGYHDGYGTCKGDASLVASNIRSGVSVFGVSGDSNIVDTSTGDATEGHIFRGRTAFVAGQKLTGSQGLFWGCRPGSGIWSSTWCLEDCSYVLPSHISYCTDVCTQIGPLLTQNALTACGGPGGVF